MSPSHFSIVIPQHYTVNPIAVSIRAVHGAAGPYTAFEVGLLLKYIQSGNGQALASVYGNYSRVVYAVALRTLQDPGFAEDMVQDIFMQMWQNPERYMGVRGDFCGWMAVVA